MHTTDTSTSSETLGQPHLSRPRRIIVIGAGLAGLGAARALAERAFEVVVLEARDRIGGRCYTKDGIDRGANWIHTTDGNPITTLARQLRVDTLFVGGDTTYTGGWEQLVLHGPQGIPLSGDEKLNNILIADAVHDDLDTLRRRILADGAADMSIQQALAAVIEQRSLTPLEKQAIEWHLTALARDDCAADTNTLSFLWWDDGYEVYGYGDSIFLQGYSALIDALAEGLEIRREQIVTTIQYGGAESPPVRVTTQHDVFEADAVIVTLPLGVLKAGTVRFEPALPASKLDAIARLGIGNLTKVIIHFTAPFWPRDQYVFGYFSGPLQDRPTVIINLWKTHRLPVLQFLVGGDKGREIERWSAQETQTWVMEVLGAVFGDQVSAPVEIIRTTWDQDPFSRGAYSYMAVGATPADIDTLAAPIGDQLFFAGEATYRHHWAATQGAYVSGLREAARIAGDPNILPPRHFTENRRWREMMMRASRFFNVLSRTVSGPEIAERLAVLSDSTIFAEVPPSELDVLAMMFEPVTFDTGQIICSTGDAAREMYVIAAGEVDVQIKPGSSIRSLRRGDVVGEYGMFSDGRRTATLIARTDCHVLSLDYQRFRRFLLAFPESALALLKLTVDQLLAVRAEAKAAS